ncbi:g8899 [Coccomyxa viridis]|uniref:G8899 protein n=1 Tax=Coccomyxa viridis TaxID=1274662 RepID=A0ABP1G1I8_9CHLO
MNIIRVTKASEEQKAFLALIARKAPRLCPWDSNQDPFPDPWQDWHRRNVRIPGTALVDRAPWPTSQLRLHPCAPICGRAFTAAMTQWTYPVRHITAVAKFAVNLGLAPCSSPTTVTWLPNPVPITLALSRTFFVDFPPLPFPLGKDPEDACLHIRWGEYVLLDHRHQNQRLAEFPGVQDTPKIAHHLAQNVESLSLRTA